MKKIYKTLVVAIITAVAGTIVFIGCKKEKENKVQNKEIVSSKETALFDMEDTQSTSLVIKFRQKGSGSGCNKYCVSGAGSCWLWCRSTFINFIEATDPTSSDYAKCLFATVTKNIDEKSITLHFSYEYNPYIFSFQCIDEMANTFTIEETIYEEYDSELHELLGTTQICTIPAGIYPLIFAEESIDVVIPISFIKEMEESIIE